MWGPPHSIVFAVLDEHGAADCKGRLESDFFWARLAIQIVRLMVDRHVYHSGRYLLFIVTFQLGRSENSMHCISCPHLGQKCDGIARPTSSPSTTMDAARSTAKTHQLRARAGIQNMDTGAKNQTSSNRPHHSALASRKTQAQTHPDPCHPRKCLNRARYYHAELGRFVSRDLAGYIDGMSLFGGTSLQTTTEPFGPVPVRKSLIRNFRFE